MIYNIYVVRVYTSAIIWQTYSYIHVCDIMADIFIHARLRKNCVCVRTFSLTHENCQSLLDKQKKCLVQVCMHFQTQ
jgi:hypothetical protein